MTIATLKTEIKDLKNALNTPLDEKLKAKLREQLSISEKTLAEMESAKTPTAKKNATKKANVVAKKSTSVLQKIKKANKKVEPKKATPKKATTAKKPSVLQQLKSKIKLTKNLSGYKNSGIDLVRDSDRPALPMGKRISKNGNVYYENRLNRVDIKQPPKRYPKLEEGGMMAKGGEIQEIKMYYHKTSGGAEYLCSEKVEGTNEGSMKAKFVVRIDGAKKYGGEIIIKPISHDRLGKYIPLYYHKTSGGAEYLCSARVEGTNEGSMRSKYVVRVDGAKSGSEMIIKGGLEYRGTSYADGGMMARGGEIRYNIKGNNSSDRIENGVKFNVLIGKAFDNQAGKDRYYPLDFIREIALTAKLVKYQGEIWVETAKDKIGKYPFLDDKDFIKALEYLDRPDIRKMEDGKYMADGGMMARGGFVSKGEMVWGKLSGSERMKFLNENFTPSITPRSQEILVDKTFVFLPKEVKIKLEEKFANVEPNEDGKYMAIGGRLKSAIMRDRAYKSNEPHEQAYTRKSRPKNPKYNYGFFADGGETEMHRAYAMGGVLQHGLETGDFIVSHDEGKMVVMNGGSKYEVNIHSGSRTKID